MGERGFGFWVGEVEERGCPHPREGKCELADVGIRAPAAEASTVMKSAVESTEPGMLPA